MDLGLRDAVVVVGGATQGMGRGAARCLAREGAIVVAVPRGNVRSEGAFDYVDKPSLDDVVAELRSLGASDALAVTADLIDGDDVERAVGVVMGRYGHIDGLVNTVGLCEIGTGAIDGDDELWARSYESVLMGQVRACRAIVPIMAQQGSGAVVNTSAMSVRHFVPRLAHYSAQKAALAHFTKNLAKDYAQRGVRVNCVLPGIITNEQHAERHRQDAAAEGISVEDRFRRNNEAWHRPTWSDRPGTPEEVGNVITFLLSRAASYVNGALVNVDGGSDGI